MLQEALLVGNQVLMIFIFIFIGMACVKTGMFTQDTGRALSNFSLTWITPCLIINSYQRPYEPEMLGRLGLSFVLALVFHIVSTAVAVLCIRRRETARYRIERVAVMFSNCGYMAIPLIQITIGEEGVAYSAAFIAIFSTLLWSLGAVVLQGKAKLSFRQTFLNPGAVGLAAGLILYFTRLPLPLPIGNAIRHISNLNTAVAMITTGIFLTTISVKRTFANKNIYYATFLRLIAVPAILLVLYKISGVTGWMPGADKVVMANMLAAACPAPASATLFPARLGMDGEYGARLIAVSTLISLLTLPVMNYLTNWLL